MTKTEKRRQKLLQDVRKTYSEKNMLPAIHPRYGATYHSLYENEKEEQAVQRSGFFIRCIIATLIFALIFIVDYHQEEIANVSSQTIINEVRKDLFSQ